MRLDGASEAGARVQSQWFSLPLRLCVECLVGPAATPARATTDGTCGRTQSGVPIEPVVNAAVCVPGDDVPATTCP